MESHQDNYMNNGAVASLDTAGRAAFIKNTYQHVALAVLVFILFEVLFINIPFIANFALSLASGWTWLLMLGGFSLVTGYAERWAMKETDRTNQYLALMLFAAAEAFIFLPMLFVVINIMAAPQLLIQAGVLTLGLFVGLSAVVLLTGKDFSFLKSALTIGGFIAIAAIVGGIVFGFNLELYFSIAMVLLAAGSILYQTSNMLHRYHSTQYVAAALGLFGALMLLFWYILSILMRFAGND